MPKSIFGSFIAKTGSFAGLSFTSISSETLPAREWFCLKRANGAKHSVNSFKPTPKPLMYVFHHVGPAIFYELEQ
jgi:hypothetical protein